MKTHQVPRSGGGTTSRQETASRLAARQPSVSSSDFGSPLFSVQQATSPKTTQQLRKLQKIEREEKHVALCSQQFLYDSFRDTAARANSENSNAVSAATSSTALSTTSRERSLPRNSSNNAAQEYPQHHAFASIVHENRSKSNENNATETSSSPASVFFASPSSAAELRSIPLMSSSRQQEFDDETPLRFTLDTNTQSQQRQLQQQQHQQQQGGADLIRAVAELRGMQGHLQEQLLNERTESQTRLVSTQRELTDNYTRNLSDVHYATTVLRKEIESYQTTTNNLLSTVTELQHENSALLEELEQSKRSAAEREEHLLRVIQTLGEQQQEHHQDDQHQQQQQQHMTKAAPSGSGSEWQATDDVLDASINALDCALELLQREK